MLALIVLLVSVYNAWQILAVLRAVRQFQLSTALWGFWLGSALVAVFVAFVVYFPGLAPEWPFLQLPIALVWFTPAIAAGMAVERKLQVMGTARTERLEKIAVWTMQLGILNVAILTVAYVYALMVVDASKATGLPRP